MKELIAFLMNIGNPMSTSKKTGLRVVKPKPFDEAKLESLTSSLGLSFIYNPQETVNPLTLKAYPPSLFVGLVNQESEEDLLATLKGLGK